MRRLRWKGAWVQLVRLNPYGIMWVSAVFNISTNGLSSGDPGRYDEAKAKAPRVLIPAVSKSFTTDSAKPMWRALLLKTASESVTDLMDYPQIFTTSDIAIEINQSFSLVNARSVSKISPTYPWKIPRTLQQHFLFRNVFLCGGLGKVWGIFPVNFGEIIDSKEHPTFRFRNLKSPPWLSVKNPWDSNI